MIQAARVALLSSIFAGSASHWPRRDGTRRWRSAPDSATSDRRNLVPDSVRSGAPSLLTDNAAPFIIGSPSDFPLLGRTIVEAGMYLTLVSLAFLLAAAGLFPVREVT